MMVSPLRLAFLGFIIPVLIAAPSAAQHHEPATHKPQHGPHQPAQHEGQHEGQHENQHHDQSNHGPAKHGQDDHDHALGAHEVHGPHHLSVLFGSTDIDGEGTAFTLGVDYEYRVNDLLGVGVIAEYAFSEINATTFLAVADIHLYKGLIMQIGPGVELGQEHDFFVTRVGALYELEYKGYTVSPQIHYDAHFGGADAWVFGLSLGKAF